MKWALLYKITNIICGRKHKKSAGVRTKDGKLLTREGADGKNTLMRYYIPCDFPLD